MFGGVHTRASLVWWLALTGLAGSCKPTEATDQRPVRLGFQRVGPYRAFFIADEKGFFREQGLRVEALEFPSSNVMAQAQVAGTVDGSGFMSFPALFAVEAVTPAQSQCSLVLPMTRASRYAAVVVPTNSPITTPEGLKGAKIGVYPSSTNVIYARMMVSRLFGSPDAAQILQIDPKNQLELLATGGIDALIGPDPMPAVVVGRKIGRVLQYAPDARYVMDPLPVGCATLSTAFAQRQPETAKRVRVALELAVDYLRDPAHAAEVRAIVARRTGVDDTVAPGLGEVDYWKVSEADRPSLQRLADLLESEGVLTAHVDASRFWPAP